MSSKIISGKAEKCSKNFINCRKHPANTVEQYAESLIAQREENFKKNLGVAEKNFEAEPSDDNKTVLRRAKADWNSTKEGVLELTKHANDLTRKDLFNSNLAERNKAQEELRSASRRYYENVRELNKVAEKEFGFKEVQNKVEIEPTSSYEFALSTLLLNEGSVLTSEEDWGGPSKDYRAQDHFNSCGVMAVENLDESFEWKTYDTINSDTHYGVKASLTCNCGEHVRKTAVLQDATLSSILGSLFGNNDGKILGSLLRNSGSNQGFDK